MEGLEASVASTSDLERTSRLDAEFFQKHFLQSSELIGQWDRDHVASLTHVSDGNHFSISGDFVDVGIPYYRGQDVTGRFFVETASPINITQEAYDRKYMRRSYLEQGDVLLSIIGTIGELSLVASEEPATCSCKLAILRPKTVAPEFLATFLSCAHGQNQIERLTRGAVQKGLILEDMDQLWVPNLSFELQVRVVRAVVAAREARENSETSHVRAEIALLDKIGLADWTPPEPLSYTASASEAFGAGRLDAQYFMPAKHQVLASLAALPGMELGARMDSIRNMFAPEREPADKLVRNYDVTDALVPILDADKEPQRAGDIGSIKKTFRDGDVAVSRLRAYLREIAVVRTGDDMPSVGSSEFIVLRPRKGQNDISPETLMVFLRSSPVQTVLKWCQDGSQHPRFSEGDLLSIPVPDAVASASAEITEIAQRGFTERHRAQWLLDAAKRAVEIAIEDNEPDALAFLDKTLEAD